MKKRFSWLMILVMGFFMVGTLSVFVTVAHSADEKTCWCCVDGRVVETTPELCKEKRGRCYASREEALKYCESNLCWCCVDGEVIQINPEMCKEKQGRCFSTKEEALKYCEPRLCWCCIDGEVMQLTAMECERKRGRCYPAKEEAEKRCREQQKLPDITSQKGMIIGGAVGGAGGKFVPFGGTVLLTDADSFLHSGGRCAFNIAYNMVNTGSAPTAPLFINRIKSDGTVISQQTNLSLNSGQFRKIYTQAYLAPGKHTLTLSLDDGHVVHESNEGNNVFKVTVVLRSSCKGKVLRGKMKILKKPKAVNKQEIRGINPQPEPPGKDPGIRGINPQPEPPGKELGIRGINPQPEPPKQK